MLDVFSEINFEDRIAVLKGEYPSIRQKLTQASKEIAREISQVPEYQKPTLDDGSINSIILFNLPAEKGERLEKFQKVFVSSIVPKMKIAGFEQIIMEELEGKQGTGVGICVFDSSDNAIAGAEAFNGLKLGQSTIQSYTMSEYESIVNTPIDSGFPTSFYNKKDMTNWMKDERHRPQFALTSEAEISVNWHEYYEKTMKPYVSVAAPEGFKETKWSPDGCYLAVLLQTGFTVFSVVPEGLTKIRHYFHKEVKSVEFSPCERYILSYNGTTVETRDSKNYIVWNLLTGEELRVFPADQNEGLESFKWSFDGNYIAKRNIVKSSEEDSLKDNCYLNVYQLPTMKLTEDPKTGIRVGIKIPYLQKFAWGKNSHKILALAYNPAIDNKNASFNKAVIYTMPSREETRWISIPYLVHEGQIAWGPSDKYVMVALETHEKKGSSKKVKAINVQVGTFGKLFELDFYRKEFLRVRSVYINPAGTRLAAVSPIKNDKAKALGQSMYYNVEVYELEEEKKSWQLKPVGGLGKINGDCVIWPRVGSFFLVVASGDGEKRNHGHVNFIQIRSIKSTDPKVPPKSDCEFIRENDFSSISSIGWDPSGAYISVTNSLNNSFWVYNAIGKLMYKETVPKLKKCFWRPAITVNIPDKLRKQVMDKMKELTKKYEEEDDKILNAAEFELRKRREREAKEFDQYLAKKNKIWSDSKAERINLRGFDDDSVPDAVLVEIEDVTEVEKENTI